MTLAPDLTLTLVLLARRTHPFARFKEANSFNQPLANWNVSGVTNMDNMFESAESFDQDISDWDVSNVETAVNFDFDSPLSEEQLPNFSPGTQVEF